MTASSRLLITGPLGSPYRDVARAHLRAALAAGARDVLLVAPSGAARRAVVAGLTRELGAVCGLRAVTLRGLPGELARRARVTPRAAVDPVVDQLLVERATRRAAAGHFPPDAPMGGLARKVASVLERLERDGVSPDRYVAVLDAADAHDVGARLLADLWPGLALARRTHGASNAELLTAAAAHVREGRAELSRTVVVLEDLPPLPRLDAELVAAVIARAGSVIAAHGHAAQLPDAPASQALAWLRGLCDWDEHPVAVADSPFAIALGRLFAPRDDDAPRDSPVPDVRVTRLEAVGEAGEMRLAVRVVRRHLGAPPVDGQPPLRPCDVRLVLHGEGRYRELAHELFGAAGIPVAAPLTRALADTPIGAVLLRLLDLALDPAAATLGDTLAVLRAPHLDVSLSRADRLERRMTTRGMLGVSSWDELALQALGEGTANRVNRLKRALAEANAGFARVSRPEESSAVLRRMARQLRLNSNVVFARRRLVRGASDPRLLGLTDLAVREDAEAWEAIERLLDETVPAMLAAAPPRGGVRGMAAAEAWARHLRQAMSATEQAVERPPADAVRLVGTGPGCDQPARVTIVLGLLEKSFPRQQRQDPFLSDDLRRRLREREGWSLVTTDEATERQRECFVRAIAHTSEALYLSCASSDAAGRPRVRSFYLHDLQAALGHEHPMAVERADAAALVPRLGEASTASELLAGLSHDVWQHLPRTAEAEARRTEAFHAHDALTERGADLSAVRDGRVVPRRPAVDAGLLRNHPHGTLLLSASQLGTLGHCGFKHFAQKVLEPQPIVVPSYDALAKGGLLHQAIFHWATRLDGWTRGEQALDELGEWLRTETERWPPVVRASALSLSNAGRDFERLDALLRAELALVAPGGVARPAWHELAFGEPPARLADCDAASRAEPFPLLLPATDAEPRTVRFRGSVDRVDLLEVDGRRYGVVIDYKTGATSEYYAKAMLKGDDLQLRLYMIALQHFWDVTPVGALYLGFGDGVRRGAVHEDFASRIAGVDHKGVAALDAATWAAFVEGTSVSIAPLVDKLVAVDVAPRPRRGDCGFCELQPICRHDPFARDEEPRA